MATTKGTDQEYARVKDGYLELRVKLGEGTRSMSGKTLVVASSRGNQPIEGTHNGAQVILGYNAYIKP